MAVSLERLARNQVIFREVNERLHEIADSDAEFTDFLCECSDVACTETIGLELDEYEAVRSMPSVFVIVSGHERLEVERVIEANERFALVEKTVPVDGSGPADGD